MLEMLNDPIQWRAFLDARLAQGHLYPSEAEDLQCFIESDEYEIVASAILSGSPMPLPQAREISKKRTGKTRTVFTYPRAENYALKLLAWGLRRYDGAFSDNLYSFRPGSGARAAMARLMRTPRLSELYAYKADIHDYFNSIDIDRLIPRLAQVIEDDPALLAFIEGMLRNPVALKGGVPTVMRKGIMAGTPISPFLANVYLMDLDAEFAAKGVPYARYSDDILVLAPTAEALEEHIASIRGTLARLGLEINPDKESRSLPHEPWTFLGFTYRDSTLDVADISVAKLKGKMRRKARALLRWRRRKNKDGGKAARAFIRLFNGKLYSNPRRDELTWARWYFPVIGTDRSLRELDRYMQDCIRYIVAGNHGKKRYNLRYATLKAWGYRPLVHESYAQRKVDAEASAPRP